ncbi:hypothetical protein [Nonomuraea dietziae]|uniref:hypothetical protein n=1 Tax=Nonomuraea dietziae TaxID=65515 RepID=UPI0031DCD905
MRAKSVVSHVLLAAVTLAFLYPLVFAVATALKPAGETFADPGALVGSQIRWQNFGDVFTYVPFQRYILNGVLVAGVGTLVVLAASALSAYAFASLRWRGRDGIFLVFPRHAHGAAGSAGRADVHPHAGVRVGGHLPVADLPLGLHRVRDVPAAPVLPRRAA